MVRSLQIINFMIGLNKTVHVMSIWKNSLTVLAFVLATYKDLHL